MATISARGFSSGVAADVTAAPESPDVTVMAASNVFHCTAARNNNLAALQELLSQEPPPDVDAVDQLSRTALHLAAWAGHVAVVALLLEEGCDPHAKAQDDMSALHFAAGNGHADDVARSSARMACASTSRTRRS